MQNPLDFRHCVLVTEFSKHLTNSLICESQFGQLSILYPKIEMMWTIQNFASFINKDGQYHKYPLNSPMVFAGVHGTYAMYLSFCLGSQEQNENEFTSIYLCVSNLETKRDVKVKFHIDALDSKDSVFQSLYMKKIISTPFGHASGFSKFIKRSDILNPANNLLVDNKLRIRCSVEIYDTPSQNFKKFENHAGVSDDLQKLLHDDTFSDVTFVVSSKKFPAHKSILATRSSVFRAMFTTEMKEKATNEVVITDIKPDVFNALLLFIYSGTVELNKTKTVCELLMAADKYALDDLKNLCEVKLSLAIDIYNVIDILIIADRYNVANLKQQALNFISSHANIVASTVRYKTWCASGDPLIGEAFEALAKNIILLKFQN